MTIHISRSLLEKLARDEEDFVVSAGHTTTSEVAVVKSASEILQLGKRCSERSVEDSEEAEAKLPGN